MTISVKKVLGICCLMLIISAVQGLAQQSANEVAKDSLTIAEDLNKGDELLAAADSARIADSLEVYSLQSQLEALRTSDTRKKQQLQARLDSIQQANLERESRIRNQVDSMRAATPGMPVTLFGDTLFRIYAKIGPFRPAERAATVTRKLERLIEEDAFHSDQLKVVASEETQDLIHSDIIIMSVTDRDAFWANTDKEALAQNLKSVIISGVEKYQTEFGLINTMKRFGMLALVLFLLALIIVYLNKGFNYLVEKALVKSRFIITGVKFRNYEFLSVDRETQVIRWIFNGVKWFLIIILVYLSLPIIFSIFPSTKDIATQLIGYILDPLRMVFRGVFGYIPELMTIAVVMFVTYNFVKFLFFLANEIRTEKLVIPGFYPDWALPTYNLLRVLVYAFAFVIIFPYLPGSGSPAFQGVSVFLGLLISLGSSSAIGNIIAGLVITYMRAFKVGDRVKIGDITGDVLEKTMLVTRLRTIKNEEVTIPNAAILNGSTVNYSTSAKERGLILHTTVTIGYDVPWRQVHELLISAATKTADVNEDPKPFILQTSLDDFYVSYQLNAYTDTPEIAARIYSDLHANIQDAFNEAGVEILSPHYRAARDGNMVTIPASYLPDDYKVPNFNVKINKDGND